MTYNILRFAEVDSTNALCKRLALEGAREGLVIVAATQTAGRGRLDRKWLSPRGGLWFSVLLRPRLAVGKAPLLTMAAAVAVAETIRETTALEATLKWPNDCLIAERKVAGILVEGKFTKPVESFAVLGVGINVNNVFNEQLRGEFLVPPTSLKEILGHDVELDSVLEKFLSLFEREYVELLRGRQAELVGHWMRLSSTLGRSVRVETGLGGHASFEGIAEKVDDDFALVVQLSNGSSIRVMAGDCVHLTPIVQF